MKVVTTMSDIASNTPALLDGLLISEFSTAREVMIRLACSQSPALEDPPPALFHASTTPNSHILYGGSLDTCYDDVEYVSGESTAMVATPENIYCIGSGMVDVCKSTARPAILYAYKKSESIMVRMVVYDCPLASMEVELFHGPPTGFEKCWFGESVKAQRALREKVYQWMRSRGEDHFPSFLYDRDLCYHTMRRGVLPFLRLRAPQNETETSTLACMLEGIEAPRGGFATLKTLAGITAESISENNISFETVFSTHVPARVPAAGGDEEVDFGSDDDSAQNTGCVQANNIPALGILSLCLLKQSAEDDADNEEYAEEAPPQPVFSRADVDRALDQESEYPSRIRGLRADLDDSCSSQMPLAFALPLLRACDTALLISSPDAVPAACGVMTAIASEEDAGLMAEHLRKLNPGTLLGALSQIVFASPRQRFLVCYPKSKVFLTPKGSFKVTDDAARRLLLLSWVTPILSRYEKLSEIKVKGVSRETIELSAQFKRQVILNRTTQIPESVVELMRDVSSRLSALEEAARAAPAPAPAVSSTAGRSFKRVLDMIGEYEVSLAKV